MSVLPKKRHGPELKCGGSASCEDFREAQDSPSFTLDGLNMGFKMKQLRYPILTLHAGTMSEGQVVFKVQYPGDSLFFIESPHLSVIQTFCNTHGLELRDEVVSIIKSRLEFNSENGSFSVPLQYVDEKAMISSVYAYVKKIQSEIA